MLQVLLHTGTRGPLHAVLDAALGVGVGVVLVVAYLLFLRYYAGAGGHEAR